MSRHRLLLVIVVSALGFGCVKLERPPLERASYVLDVARPAIGKGGNGILQISRFEVYSRFSGTSFVYRLGEWNYATDYYNRFLAPPGGLITEEVGEWLAASGVFVAVAGGGRADFVLEGEVSALYGDFRDEPQAVLGLRLTLREAGEARRVLFQKSYDRSIHLGEKTPEALVSGWNRALAEILGALEGDLREVQLFSAPRGG